MLTLGNAHKKHSKGVGTIVGAAFFLMILFTGYTFYVLSNQVTNAQQQSIIQMNDFDLKRTQENVTISTPNPVSGNLELTIKNTGPQIVNIIAVGYYDGSTWIYDNTKIAVKVESNWVSFDNLMTQNKGVYLSPWESYRIRVNGSPYLIQVLTDKGTIKTVGYP
jgi:hypothetical protein